MERVSGAPRARATERRPATHAARFSCCCCLAPQQHAPLVIARYRSWPAVSQICALIVLPSTWAGVCACASAGGRQTASQTRRCHPNARGGRRLPWHEPPCCCRPRPAPRRLAWMLRVANSTPIVDLDSSENSLRVKRDSRLDFPTPESPISTTLNR